MHGELEDSQWQEIGDIDSDEGDCWAEGVFLGVYGEGGGVDDSCG